MARRILPISLHIQNFNLKIESFNSHEFDLTRIKVVNAICIFCAQHHALCPKKFDATLNQFLQEEQGKTNEIKNRIKTKIVKKGKFNPCGLDTFYFFLNWQMSVKVDYQSGIGILCLLREIPNVYEAAAQ